jgi:hypothetical protein
MHFTRSSDGRLYHITALGKVSLGPHISEIAHGSRWADDERDKFPSDQEWFDSFERMIAWFAAKFTEKYYGRVITRLRSTQRTRDETFAEITAAYFIEKVCAYPVIDWEPEFARNKTADFAVRISSRSSLQDILVEVKARVGQESV